MIRKFSLLRHSFRGLLGLAALCVAVQVQSADHRDYRSHRLGEHSLTIETSDGSVTLSPLGTAALEVHYQRDGLKQLPSFAIDSSSERAPKATLDEEKDRLVYRTDGLTAVIHKSPFRIDYLRNQQPLIGEELGFFANETMRGFRFALAPQEKLLGGGERVLGMDRRGQRLPLYNRAHYGYTTESSQMYFSLPAVMSSNKYILLFDNSATGNLDLGASEEDVLQFEAVGGRTSYIIVAGDTYPQLIENYVAVTGKQPLPPRWALGNFASRFGYRTEQEVRATVDKFAEEDFPLDAVVLDLYWFGPDIKGHMGNLAWDKNAFPRPEKMMADFNERGINTILVTEPFILSTSERWDEAVANNALAKNLAGQPKRFDFYFGNTGLIDVFSEEAGDWFWNIYDGLLQQGVAGWWGDLGEPEVHPSDTVHAIGMADEIHNAYGHKWAQLLHDKQTAQYPERRPFIMMRAGFAGSQRYGMIPWTGDVAREWGGLQPQVELALSMSLLGFGYTHSDLGGFAGGEKFDRELYIRWLQYGVFQPVYRPHAQEHIASEPVFHDRRTRNITREFVKLRYRLLPYNYTLAFENSQTGMPLMRPLFFENESDSALIDYKDAYLWGDDFLVAPVTEADVDEVSVKLPGGVWFDYWNDDQYSGDLAQVDVDLETIPVLVRAGAFIPTIDDIATTRDYSSKALTLDYYAHESAPQSSAYIYEDDGTTVDAFDRGHYEKLTFTANRSDGGIDFAFDREGDGYKGMPEARTITLNIHNWQQSPASIEADGDALTLFQREKDFAAAPQGAWYDKRNDQLLVKFTWGKQPLQLAVKN
ncbi:oligosaccharide 4-alpha-D-glucosyltransferase [Microbulbifer donghaiensis]|uniref:Oligosaccharide 4-alpha-D-glucosyltransferase n=1 Tax=Microbulbifer donghaiensis TaxID=494016 RepID=A0A1M5FCI7_9GAMM|nr:TIM-barrel domain-containing protein [Microbulbifer donghaiensis]SHF89244.1 oligosaccharide 4-alpha-D-glucosyltransferase [Microbulbifer donghaiensis]